jgi:signal recognition particle receptor subunit alpha
VASLVEACFREDLQPVLGKLKDNLIAKNIASEVATSLIESVMIKLEGSVMGTFQSIACTVKDALTQSLMKLLTSKRRVTILRDVLDAKENLLWGEQFKNFIQDI